MTGRDDKLSGRIEFGYKIVPMAKFTLTHEIGCSIDKFWEVFFDRAFNEQLYRQELGFPDFSIIEHRDGEREVARKTSGRPKMNVPGPVAKLFGDGFRYTEEGVFDKGARIYRWKTIPSTLADKLRQEGSVRAESLGDTRVRRVVELVVEAKIFGIGGMVESAAEKQLRDGWEASAAFMNRWVAK